MWTRAFKVGDRVEVSSRDATLRERWEPAVVEEIYHRSGQVLVRLASKRPFLIGDPAYLRSCRDTLDP